MRKLSLCFMYPLILLAGGGLVKRETSEEYHQLQVSIIVSSLNENNRPRELIISWESASPVSGDWIGLFDTDPSENLSTPLFTVSPSNSSGWEKTSVHETAQNSRELGFVKKCLGFWVAYVSQEDIVKASSCLHTEPTWMSDMKTGLSPLLLRRVFLPGTHDSGSYKEYDPIEGEGLIFKYTITQEEDILSQLINGVRYLDLRIGYYGHLPEKWFVNHGFISIHPLKQVLDDIRSFLENTNEIVVIDFHEFPVGFGSNNSIHGQLVEFITQELGQYAASPSLTWDAKLSDFWSTGKRLLISYNKNNMVANSNILWRSVSQKWPNVRSLEELYNYLSSVVSNPPSSVGWAAMTQFTPSATDVILDYFGGLRKMADMVNHNVTTWYSGEWGQTANIVAPDFFRGTGIVDAAIKWNKIHAKFSSN